MSHLRPLPIALPRTRNPTTSKAPNGPLSPDGTTLLTSSADNTLRTFILYLPPLSIPPPPTPPTNLPPKLAPRPPLAPHPHALTPHTTHPHPTPIYSTALHPSFTLSSPPTTLYLSSPAHLPIRLLSPFAPGILSSYPLVHPQTESHTAAYSLLFARAATAASDECGAATGPRTTGTFFAGTSSTVSIFDLNRNGEGPLAAMPTIPSRRKKLVGGGVGMKGCVSAMGMAAADGLLAAGTFGRWVGLYDGQGLGGGGGAEGALEPCWGFGAHGDAVSSAVLHPSGTVLATCSGQRRPTATGAESSESGGASDDGLSSSAASASSETGCQADNSLKIWAL
ncbi:MAG: hypothetical protein FRX48_09419 [Lasallia pustulata]|uniref:WD40/YVTN repeat-like-containing domain n=1 Tax=Lasallia pustulata TaxID=136370 RepID=A0A5M8PCH7_9LECA|nr:MAG: hypothetical protein FRX48_09419 [Lasallia pustulata]